jgi:hypothetical protein
MGLSSGSILVGNRRAESLTEEFDVRLPVPREDSKAKRKIFV